MPFVENEEEFIANQACDRVRTHNGWVFKNGAYMVDNQGRYYPSGDLTECLMKRILYFDMKIEGLIRMYRHDYKAIAQQADIHKRGVGPAPSPGWKGHLKSLTLRIEHCKRKLAELKSQLPSTFNERMIDVSKADRVANGRKIESELSQLPSY